MRKFRTVLALLLVLGLTILASGPVRAASEAPGFAPDQILVKFNLGTDEATQGQIHRKNGGAVVAEIAQLGIKVVRVNVGNVPDKVKAYRGEKTVAFAEPDFIAEALGDPVYPNDPYFGSQWGLSQINDHDADAPEAWGITTGSPAIRIAILDTGVDQDHEDLAKIVANKNFTSSSTVDDRYGHGTHVAGIAAASTNNSKGVAGLGYNCAIMNGKVLGDTGSGSYSGIASGIIWAADNGAKVINMSLGGTSSSSTLQQAVDYAWNKGVVVVAAAGNSNTSAMFYPAAYTNCIAVAATEQNDARASFSNYGNWVDVAAPGVSIYSTLPNHSNSIGGTNYGSLSGTSMASPLVAGLAGLVWSTSYGTTNVQVRDRVQTNAEQAGTMWSSYGIKRINAYNAVASATTLPDTTPPTISNVKWVATATTATITWTTDEPADSKINYGPTSGYGSSDYSSTLVTSHSLTLTGLSPATTYHYQVISVDASGNPASSTDDSFTTMSTLNMSVQSLSVVLVKSGTSYSGQATVTVMADGSPVQGATVSGKWSGATTDTDFGVTDASGKAVVLSDKVRKPARGTAFIFTVSSVTHSDFVWDGNSLSGSATVP
jgi:thermitase